MTPEEELIRFRRQEVVRPRRAKTTNVVFVVLGTIGVVALSSAFYVQTDANKNSREHAAEIQKMQESLKLAEEHTAKLEAMAMREAKVADSLSIVCGHKP